MPKTSIENSSVSPELYSLIARQRRTRTEIKRRIAKGSVYGTLKIFWGTIIDDPFVDNWHLKYLCDEMQIVGEWIINRKPAEYDLIINIPPGTTKSTICSVIFHVWLWINAPWVRIISASHASDLSEDHASKSRDVMNSDLFRELFPHKVILKADKNRKDYYENIKNGSRCATSVDGNIMGKHAHCLLIDDLVDPKTTASETLLAKANTYMGKTLSTRKIDKKNTPTILIMQRLHEVDPTGFLLEKSKEKGKRVRHICIPADNSLGNIQPPELEDFYIDGLMDPNRLPASVIEDMKVDMTEDEASGQLNQSPVPAGGNILKREWFQPYTELPKQRPISTAHSWDTAFKKGKENAYNVGMYWEEYENGYYLEDVFCEKLTYPELKDAVIMEDAKNDRRPDETIVEDKATGTSLMQELAIDTTINFVPILPEGDKVARAHSISPTVRARNVYIRSNAPWSQMVISQLTMFPNCKIKDIMDAFSQYLNHKRGNRVLKPTEVKGGNSSGITSNY